MADKHVRYSGIFSFNRVVIAPRFAVQALPDGHAVKRISSDIMKESVAC